MPTHGCIVAVSFTSTIALNPSANEGRRSLTLIPDYHRCMVFNGQLVETVAHGFDRLCETGGRPVTTIAGPSPAADIEMSRVKGVHGPRFLDVILVGGE
ncbi:MAG: LUD domain-containing protein [Terriglobia bacterium]